MAWCPCMLGLTMSTPAQNAMNPSRSPSSVERSSACSRRVPGRPACSSTSLLLALLARLADEDEETSLLARRLSTNDAPALGKAAAASAAHAPACASQMVSAACGGHLLPSGISALNNERREEPCQCLEEI